MVPVYLSGLGVVLPKGAVVPAPRACGVGVGRTLRWQGERDAFMAALGAEFARLARADGLPRPA